MQSSTHLAIDASLCGRVADLGAGRSVVEFDLLESMQVDARGLVHGGFVFGAADYAAMLAVNDPHVVLGSAEVRFLRPCRVGEQLRFEAQVESAEGRKRKVAVSGRSPSGEVFSGSFVCFVLDRHVLDGDRR